MTSGPKPNLAGHDENKPQYLQSIDRCLSRRDKLLAILSDVMKVAPWLKRDSQTISFQSAMQRGATALEFVTSLRLAPCLPLVLMMSEDADTKNHDALVERMSNYLQHAYRRRWIWQLLSYPVVLLVAYMVAWIVLSITLLPAFRDLYEGIDLRRDPATLRWLKQSEQWEANPIGASISMIAYCFCVLSLFKAIPYALEYASNWWFIGNFTRSSKRQLLGMSRFTGTLAALLKIDAPVPDALRIAGIASGYYLFRENAARAANAWTSSAVHIVRLPICFPETLHFAIHSPRGRCEVDLIERLSNIYTQRLERRIELGRNLAGPIATVIGGILIGGLYANFLRPLLQLITSLSS